MFQNRRFEKESVQLLWIWAYCLIDLLICGLRASLVLKFIDYKEWYHRNGVKFVQTIKFVQTKKTRKYECPQINKTKSKITKLYVCNPKSAEGITLSLILSNWGDVMLWLPSSTHWFNGDPQSFSHLITLKHFQRTRKSRTFFNHPIYSSWYWFVKCSTIVSARLELIPLALSTLWKTCFKLSFKSLDNTKHNMHKERSKKATYVHRPISLA